MVRPTFTALRRYLNNSKAASTTAIANPAMAKSPERFEESRRATNTPTTNPTTETPNVR